MGPRSEMNCAGTTQTKELKVGGRKAGGPFWRVAEVVSQHGERTWGSFQRGRGWLGGGYSPDDIVRAWAPWRRKGWGFSYDPNVVQNRSFYQKYVVSHCSLDPSNAPLETLSPGLCSGIDVTADRGRGHRQGQADALASFGWSFLLHLLVAKNANCINLILKSIKKRIHRGYMVYLGDFTGRCGTTAMGYSTTRKVPFM